jgi:dienelactone hydrolase
MIISYRNILFSSLLIAVVFTGSCGPQSQKKSSPESKTGGIRSPTPIFYPQTKGPYPAILLLPQAVHNISSENANAENLAAEGYVARAADYGDVKFIGIFNDAARMNILKQ